MISHRLRPLLLVMLTVVALAVVIARAYYKGQNRWIDPRIVPARELYASYNNLAMENKLEAVLELLDTIESIYARYPYYTKSYEPGVVNNNRAVVYLTRVMAAEQNFPGFSLSKPEMDSLVSLAEGAEG